MSWSSASESNATTPFLRFEVFSSSSLDEEVASFSLELASSSEEESSYSSELEADELLDFYGFLMALDLSLIPLFFLIGFTSSSSEDD